MGARRSRLQFGVKNMGNYRGLSLFANVGIAETFMKETGYPVLLANELLPKRVQFYKHLHNNNIIQGDITDPKIFTQIIKEAKKAHINFVLATPPCQGMSAAGLRNPNDPRNTLIIETMRVLKILTPEFMLIENVKEMYNTSILYNGQPVNIKTFIQEQCNQLGYKVKFNVYNVADYGTPQNRYRSFTRIFKPSYDWADPTPQPVITVREAIGDLPSLESGEDSGIQNHKARVHPLNHVIAMKHTPTGRTALENPVYYPKKPDGTKIKGWPSSYKRMEWDKPAPTITMANGNIGSQNNVHPGRLLPDGTYSDARALTLLELFRLTGLPDDWDYPKWASEHFIREVIGEAIPPLMVKTLFSGLRRTESPTPRSASTSTSTNMTPTE